MRFRNTTAVLENRFTVRIPQEHFETALSELSALADFVAHKNITSTDVSEEYVDLQTRLATKLEVKQRYDAILRSKAKTVEDLLKAEDKIRVLQEEIEAAQGRLKFLSNKVALSTIQIDLYQTVTYTETPKTLTTPFGSRAKKSVSLGWEMVQSIFLGLLYIWPLLLIALGVLAYFKYRKK